MNTVKKFTAIQIGTKTVDDSVFPKFKYGDVSGPYYNEVVPETEFDTEQGAIEWAFNENKNAKWMIVPTISFIDENRF